MRTKSANRTSLRSSICTKLTRAGTAKTTVRALVLASCVATARAVIMETALTRALRIRHPIICAPMVGMAKGELAGAVAGAGGVGLVGVGSAQFFSPEKALEEWEVAKAKASSGGGSRGALGFGFLENFMDDGGDETFSACLAAKPDVVWLSFGDEPGGRRFDMVKEAGIKLITMVFSAEEARRAVARGADVVVLQGCDAGGHGRQNLSLSIVSLVPATRAALAERGSSTAAAAAAAPPVPIVAAGGIVNGGGLAAALMLGADGVVLGTRFVSSRESAAKDGFKSRVLAVEDATAGTAVAATWDHLNPGTGPAFLKGGFVGRAIADSAPLRRFGFMAAGADAEASGITEPDRAWYKDGDYGVRAVWCGAGAGLVTESAPAGAGRIVEEVVAEAVARLREPSHFCLTGGDRGGDDGGERPSG